jgi:hypothetical protein
MGGLEFIIDAFQLLMLDSVKWPVSLCKPPHVIGELSSCPTGWLFVRNMTDMLSNGTDTSLDESRSFESSHL